MEGETRDRFKAAVFAYYKAHGRHDLPWRTPRADGSFDPYHILVSEIMLQQTQVARVILKYQDFLKAYPTTSSLAKASLKSVLDAWNGLGYNRRANYLRQAAIAIEHNGVFPKTSDELQRLPGVGPNTAGAVMAYAYNQPACFIETNIRTVFIHHFFSGQTGVSDDDIIKLVKETIDQKHPREWYWALMDYGSYLKAAVGNLNSASTSYKKQSVFTGSNRQIRGQVLRALLAQQRSDRELQEIIRDDRLKAVLSALMSERLVAEKHGLYSISP